MSSQAQPITMMPVSVKRSDARLLMVANCFPPRNISGSKRPFRLAKYLPEFGYGTEIISASGALSGWDHVHSTPNGAERRPIQLTSRFFEFIQRHFLPYTDSIPWIPYAVNAASEAIAHSNVTAILSTSPPVASHLAALEIKRRRRLKWIADFRDPLLGNPFRTRKGAWIYDAALERLIFRFADAVIANTDAMASCWRQRYPQWAHKINTIWNGYDPEEMVQATLIPEADFKVLAHVGSIYGGRVPTPLLRSIHRLIEKGRLEAGRFRVRLVGPIEPPDLLERDGALAQLSGKVIIEREGKVSENEARAIMAQSDYLCLLDTNETNTGLQIPAKLFDYIRIGRPIVALTNQDSPAERVLTRSGVPHACIFPDSSEDEIDNKMAAFLNSPTAPVQPSPWFWQTFDGRNQSGHLASILECILAQ